MKMIVSIGLLVKFHVLLAEIFLDIWPRRVEDAPAVVEPVMTNMS